MSKIIVWVSETSRKYTTLLTINIVDTIDGVESADTIYTAGTIDIVDNVDFVYIVDLRKYTFLKIQL